MTRTELAESDLTHSILNSFFKVFNRLGPGLSESIYMNSMEIDLVAKGHIVSREVDAVVYFDGHRVGHQRLDMVVDDKVIVEGKATEKLQLIAEPRTKAYLRISKFEIGLLLHFGLRPQFIRLFIQNSDKPLFKSDNRDE
jgi:GxxExxY protein